MITRQHFSLWMTLAVFLLVSSSTANGKMSFDADVADDCASKVDSCSTSEDVFLNCPVTCLKSLKNKEFTMYQAENSYEFYELEIKKESGGSVELTDFEGYVFLYLTVPE